jgi:hypothetical protein
VGQIANLPCFQQVGNLPHVAVFLERAIASLAEVIDGSENCQ